MEEIEHPEVLEKLREKIRKGESVVEAMRFLIKYLKLGPESRLIVIIYFRTAFGMELRDASQLGAWEFFDGGSWSDEAIITAITPLLLQK